MTVIGTVVKDINMGPWSTIFDRRPAESTEIKINSNNDLIILRGSRFEIYNAETDRGSVSEQYGIFEMKFSEEYFDINFDSPAQFNEHLKID